MADKNRSITDLIPELGTEVVRLMKSEADLLRAEIDDKVQRMETAIGSMAAGGILLLAALLVLLQAIIVALTKAGLGAGWASLLVGVVTAAVGAALLGFGSSKTGKLTPRRSVDEAQKTVDMLKEKSR